MRFHCDALLPIEQRYLSEKYRRLSPCFNPYAIHPVYADELRIFMQTPGLHHVHVRHMMRWDHNVLAKARLLLTVKQPDPELLHQNAASITIEDGELMLRSLLEGYRNFAHVPPLYVTRYLQARRRRGATSFELADEFGTTHARIKRWWRADVFDPLSGRSRPRETLRRNRYFAPRLGVVL